MAQVFKFVNVRGITRHLNLEDVKPRKLPDGRWRSPRISQLQIARMRKQAVDAGVTDFPIQKTPAKNPPVKYKGPNFLAKQKKRHELIAQKMKDMPQKIDEYYAQMRARRVRTYDPLYLVRHGFGRMK